MSDSEPTAARDPRRSQKLILVGALVLIGVLVAVILIARSGGGDDHRSISSDLSTKPAIEAPSDPPPTELESHDIVVGDGATAESGDTVDVQYVGVDYSTGRSSTPRGETTASPATRPSASSSAAAR